MSVASSLTTDFHDHPDAAYIAVMGPTGTGKTTFINLLSSSNLKVGSGLESCTATVQTSRPFELDGQKIMLVDSPGFDDTKLADTSVLNMIAAYMSFAHDHGRRLAGIIYLHRILDNRMGGISTRNFRMFRNLCGDRSLRNVVIATTMWDGVDPAIGEAREQEISNKDLFFKPALEKGARLTRHFNNVDSAQTIVRSLISLEEPSITVQIQEELRSGLDISETQAGKELGRELFEQMSRHREEMRGLMNEIQIATRERDEESRRELTQERSRMEDLVVQLQAESVNMVNGYRDALMKLEDRLRIAEASAAAARLSSAHAAATASKASGNEYPGQQTHSPIVQAVAATENSNAVLEGKLAAAVPVVGFWGKLSVMLAPFSLTWK